MLVFPICPFIGKWSSKISPHSYKEYSLTDLAKIVIKKYGPITLFLKVSIQKFTDQ